MALITDLTAREILDSRGFPTVEAEVRLADGSVGRASVPSGASTGKHEALEKRDGDQERYSGKGVTEAVEIIKTQLASVLKDTNSSEQITLDTELKAVDGTKNLSQLGANTTLAVSLAVARAEAISIRQPLYQYLATLFHEVAEDQVVPLETVPRPFFNILNGGAHTQWQGTDFQEFMVVPMRTETFSESLEQGSEVYHSLQSLLRKKGYSTLVGDEGGFAPALKSNQEAIELLLQAIELAGLKPGPDIGLALDPATSELLKDGAYQLKTEKRALSGQEMVAFWQDWVNQYPIISIEDGLAEDDTPHWQSLTKKLGDTILIVGDDLLVTNPERITQAVAAKACNALLLKVNQIGTLTEALTAAAIAYRANWSVIVSHRSGETEDTFIADLAVGIGAEYVKMGAPARSERTAKYNQLLRIEEELRKTN